MRETVGAGNVVSAAHLLACLACDLALLIWAILVLMRPDGPRGEELLIIYWWAVPMVMLGPAMLAIRSWLTRWEFSRAQLFLYNFPFALALVAWAWIASLPT